VKEVLYKLKVNNVPGEDWIPPGVLKFLDNTLYWTADYPIQHYEVWRIPEMLINRDYYALCINLAQEMTWTSTEEQCP